MMLAGRPTKDSRVLNPELARQVRRGSAPLRDVISEPHLAIVRLSHTLCKRECAVAAKEPNPAMCDLRGMRKAHPIRPHLLAWRRHMDKTQEWLAEQIGKHHATVLRAERGDAGVDDATSPQ